MVFQAYSKLIMNTETDLQGIYKIPNGDQVLTIWLRPQTQFLEYYDITPPCIFTILSGLNGQNITIFKYIPLDDRWIVIQIESYQQQSTITERVQLHNLYYDWVNIIIYLEQNQLTRVIIYEKSIDIKQTQEIQYLYTWQNTTYTCQIYDKYQQSMDDIILLIIQSNQIFNQYFKYIQNYRNQIQMKIFGQFQLTQTNLSLIRIDDQLGYIEISQSNQQIIIKFLCFQKGNEMQETSFPKSNAIQNYWYSIELIFYAYSVSYQIQYVDQIYDGTLYSTFNFFSETNDENLVFSLSVSISSDFLNYKFYVINKNFEVYNITTEQLCYQNCKYCDKLKCLECEGNLTTETDCQCYQNQQFDQHLGICVDKTLYFQVNPHDVSPQCQVGYFLNIKTNRCQQCPKLNEYTCTECVFQTEKWILEGECRFQEFSQLQFIGINVFQMISMNKIEKLYDIEHKVIFDDQTSNDEYTNQIFVKVNDPYQIYFEKCEKKYFYDFEIQKCLKKNRRNLQQFNYRNQMVSLCNIGSISINQKCQKCQINCLNCYYLEEQRKFICILPAPQFDIDDKSRIYKCNNNCQTINKQDLDQLQELNEYCIIENCKICIEGSCLLCNENYVADPENFCMKGHYYSESYNLDMGKNYSKPQLNLNQMLFLTKQIIQYNLKIDYQNTIQIIFLANNFTSIRPKNKYPNGMKFYKECEIQTSYMNSLICEKTSPNYQYLNNNLVAYCPENKCHYDLSLNMDIILSNKHSILYEDKLFTSFAQFFGNLDLHDISVSNIIVNAKVYVYDSPQQVCITRPLFLFRSQNSIKYHLNLDFLGFQAFFPNCLLFQEINFQYILIENLQTDSSIQLKIDCFNFTLRNSSFFGNESPIFDINAKNIMLDNIEIKNFKQHENVSIFQFSSSDQIIEQLVLSQIDISNIKLKFISLIQIYDYVENGVIRNINIFDSQFLDQSLFLSTIKSCNVSLQNIHIEFSNFSQSKFISIQEDQFYFRNEIYISDFLVQNVILSDRSIFIISLDPLYIQRFRIISTNISNSQFIQSYQNVLMENIIFQDLQLFQSQIFLSKGSRIQIYNLLMIDSNILYSLRLLQLDNQESQIHSVTFLNCSYYPNFQPITINNNNGIIDISNIIIDNISIDKNAIYFDFIQINNKFSMLTLSSQNINIHYVFFNNIQVHIQPLISIYSQKLMINFLSLHNIEVQIYQNYLIIIKSSYGQSYHKLEKIIISQLNIKTNNRILQSNQRKQFFLIIFEGIKSKRDLFYILVHDVSSQIETQIFQVQSQFLKMQRIVIMNLDQVGLINQNDSQCYIQNFIYNQSNLIMQTQIVSLFKIDPMYKEVLYLHNSIFHNLANPLMQWSNKNQLLIRIERMLINQISLLDNIINAQTLLNLQDISYVFISQIYIFDNYRKSISQQFLMSGANIHALINQIKLTNSQLGILNIINCINCVIQKFFIRYGSLNQPLIQFFNYRGTFSIQYGLFQYVDLQQHSLIDIISNQSIHQMSYLNIIHLQINRFKAGNMIQFYQQNEENYLQAAILLKNIKLEKSSFSNSIFKFNAYQLKISIKRLSFLDVTCEQFIQSNQRQIRIQMSLIINLLIKQTFNKQKLIIQQSQLYQTNLILMDNVIKDNQTIQFYDNTYVKNQNQFPIQIKFNSDQYFYQIYINHNTNQIQFTKNNSVIYLPAGQTFEDFQFFDIKSQEHQRIYQQFVIHLNYQIENPQDQEIQCSLTQFIDGEYKGQFSNYESFKLTNGQNILEDLIFIFNPYQKYKYLQNNLNCFNQVSNYTIIFNVKILPCQIGEYLHQNKCLKCDVNKNLYSVTFKAQYCHIIDIYKMSNIKIGQIQLKPNFWRPSYSSNMIEQCQIENVCNGGWLNGDQTCHASRVGALCKECDIYNIKGQGQYAQNNQDCLLCHPNYTIIFKGLAIFIWMCMITYINYNSNLQLTQRYLQFKLLNHKYSDILMRQSIDQVSIIVKIFTNYIFVLYLIKDNLNFINNDFLNTIDFISNPSLVVTNQIDCVLVKFHYLDIQYIQLIFRLFVPLFLLSIFYILYLNFVLLKLTKFRFNSIIIITYCIYLFNQQLIFEIQIKLLSYIEISGIKWQYLNQQFQYYTNKHLQLIRYFIAPSTAIVLIIPFSLFLTLNLRNRRLFNNIKKFGHIYCDYRQQVYYWEIFRIYSKYLNIFFIIQKDTIKQSSIVMFMVLNQFISSKTKPYGLNNLNLFEQTQYSILIFCLIAIFYLSDSLPLITNSILILVNSIFIIEVVNHTLINMRRKYSQQIKELKQKIIQKVPSLFKILKLKETISTQQLNKLRLSVTALQKKSKSIKNQVNQINPSVPQSYIQSPQFEVEMMIMKTGSINTK